jgi:hypothetical protein
VRTVAAVALWPAEGALLAGELPAKAAVIPPPAVTAARARPAMMILGFRMISS